MPFESAKQRRLMYAAASGRLRKKGGPSPEEARSFIRHSGETPPKGRRRRLKGRRKRKES